jgi:hypothetical protein
LGLGLSSRPGDRDSRGRNFVGVHIFVYWFSRVGRRTGAVVGVIGAGPRSCSLVRRRHRDRVRGRVLQDTRKGITG